ncbi:MAG: phosphotransferase, partial [Chloroflexota bacterium]|nr:phosphotransferase [Chloroflexota bacterium]
MEQRWERHYPFLQLDHPALERLVGAAFPGVRVLAAEPLAGGLRNTNYRVRLAGPAARDVVLRLYTADPAACRREAALAALVGGTVPVPPVLYAAPDADPPFAVTAWIEGMRLDDLLRAGDPTNEGAATAAGEVLARIHSVTFPSAGFLGPDLTIREPLDLSDTGWAGHMEHFLVRGRAGAALGGDLTQRLRRFVAVHAPRLASLRGARTLVHADYKPWNLLLCRPDDLRRSAAQDTRSAPDAGEAWRMAGVLDWE